MVVLQWERAAVTRSGYRASRASLFVALHESEIGPKRTCRRRHKMSSFEERVDALLYECALILKLWHRGCGRNCRPYWPRRWFVARRLEDACLNGVQPDCQSSLEAKSVWRCANAPCAAPSDSAGNFSRHLPRGPRGGGLFIPAFLPEARTPSALSRGWEWEFPASVVG